MGVVYEASDQNGQPIAVKTLSDDAAGDPELVKRFEREAHLGMHLQHTIWLVSQKLTAMAKPGTWRWSWFRAHHYLGPE